MATKPSLLGKVVACWPLAGVFFGLALMLNGLMRWSSPEKAHATLTATQVSAASQTASVNIEDIRVGQRVITDVPGGLIDLEGRSFEPLSDGSTRVDPASWRLIRMRAEDRWPDGTIDDINIETLQPVAWIQAGDVRVGSEAPLPLDLVEMGLPSDLRAQVLAIEPCADIEMSAGRVVLTTVNHLNAAVIELTLAAGSSSDPVKLRPTALHKFYSVSDDAWVSAEELEIGDVLDGQESVITVVGTEPVAGAHRVYNLTVEGDHVYRVSKLGTLVHNNGCGYFPSMNNSAMDVIANIKNGTPLPKPLVKMPRLPTEGFPGAKFKIRGPGEVLITPKPRPKIFVPDPGGVDVPAPPPPPPGFPKPFPG